MNYKTTKTAKNQFKEAKDEIEPKNIKWRMRPQSSSLLVNLFTRFSLCLYNYAELGNIEIKLSAKNIELFSKISSIVNINEESTLGY